MAIPVNLSLRSSCCLRVFMCVIMESALMLDRLLRLLVFFPDCTVRLYSRLWGGGPLDVPGQWQCATCGALRCWPTMLQMWAAAQLWRQFSPRGSTYLDTHGAVGGMPQVFSVLFLFMWWCLPWPLPRLRSLVLHLSTRVWFMVLWVVVPPPKRSQTPPTSRRLTPLLVLALVM